MRAFLYPKTTTRRFNLIGTPFDWIILTSIYLLALGVTLWFALTIALVSDRQHEYLFFRAYLFKGKYWGKDHGVLGSSLTVILFPYLVHETFHINHLLAFKITPCFFCALMPAFVYLISRQYLNIEYSIIASMVLFSNYFFLYYPNIGRNSIAFGFLAGMFWALLNGHTIAAPVFAILIVFSHYGTTYLTLYVLGTTSIVLAVTGNEFMDIVNTLGVMAIVTAMWHMVYASDTGKVCINFIWRTITFSNKVIFRRLTELSPGEGVEEVAGGIRDVLKLETKESATQVALGKGMLHASIPRKIEFMTSWLIVMAVTAGLAIAFIEDMFPIMFLVMAGALYSTILATMLSPRLSRSYGVIKVYFTAMILLAPCFAIGTMELSKILDINGYIIPSVLVLIHASCVSGIMHSLFGITKRRLVDTNYFTPAERVYYDGGLPE